jgi:hypothetical protein
MLIRDPKLTTAHVARVHIDEAHPWVRSVCGALVRTLSAVVIVERADIGIGISACQRCQDSAGYPLTQEPPP